MKHPCGIETTDREAAETYEPNRIQVANAARLKDGYHYHRRSVPWLAILILVAFVIGVIWFLFR